MHETSPYGCRQKHVMMMQLLIPLAVHNTKSLITFRVFSWMWWCRVSSCGAWRPLQRGVVHCISFHSQSGYPPCPNIMLSNTHYLALHGIINPRRSATLYTVASLSRDVNIEISSITYPPHILWHAQGSMECWERLDTIDSWRAWWRRETARLRDCKRVRIQLHLVCFVWRNKCKTTSPRDENFSTCTSWTSGQHH